MFEESVKSRITPYLSQQIIQNIYFPINAPHKRINFLKLKLDVLEIIKPKKFQRKITIFENIISIKVRLNLVRYLN